LKKTVTLIVIVLLFGSVVLSAEKPDQFVEAASVTGNAGFEAGFHASSSLEWNRTYGGIGSDFALALVQTTDGGYTLAGNTASFGAGGIDVWLVRTDVFGNMLWNRTYGGAGEDRPLALVRTVDGGYALAGRTASFGAGSGDFWLVKTDASGNHLWNRTYGGAGEDRAYGLVQTVDGGYALTGVTCSFGAVNGDAWLVKTDAFGNHLWNKTYGGVSEDVAYALVERVDGGYALLGPTYSYGAGSSDVWLLETDAHGNAKWNQTYGGTSQEYACSLVQLSDGGYAAAGGTKSLGAGSDDFWLIKTVRDATTIVVPDDYSSIQEAINNAIDGDAIFVKAGTYYEHVVVNKTVSLVGEDVSTTFIDGNETGRVIDILGDGVNVTGFTVQRGGGTILPDLDAGICLNGTRGCTISGSNIVDNGCFGIHLFNSEQNTVSGNNLTRNALFAIELSTSSNNIISFNIATFNPQTGIGMHASSHNNTVFGNTVTNSTYGISSNNAQNSTISSNNLAKNSEIGIWMQAGAANNTMIANNITDCRYGIKIEEQANNNTVSGNILVGGQSGIKVLNARYTDICNNTIFHNYGSEWDAGIHLDYAGYSVVHDNKIFDNSRGIVLYASSPYVSICGNNVTSNEYGIRVAMGGSNYVNISGNYVASNRGYGIDVTGFGGLGESNYATIARNFIMNNTFEAVGLGIGSNYNTVVQNNMIRNGHAAVTLERHSNYNTIIQNNMIENGYGICFDVFTVNSTHNTILKNNIINNTQQVRIVPGSVNAWNGSYPSGGNYWSDYNGSDHFKGPYQNVTGSDGIGDAAYPIDSNNSDRYPLMEQYIVPSHDTTPREIMPSKTVVGQGFGLKINVTVTNWGASAETFNVSVYADTREIERKQVSLASGNSAILVFDWNTSDFVKADYVISAYSWPVEGENITLDNTLAGDRVIVALVGDITGPGGWPDGKVDMRDIGNVAILFSVDYPSSRYNANCDIIYDLKIDMKDISFVARNFGAREEMDRHQRVHNSPQTREIIRNQPEHVLDV
jgi:parallel beta-helix repeat protein